MSREPPEPPPGTDPGAHRSRTSLNRGPTWIWGQVHMGSHANTQRTPGHTRTSVSLGQIVFKSTGWEVAATRTELDSRKKGPRFDTESLPVGNGN